PLIAVLGAIGNKVRSKKEIWIACIGSGFILGTVSYIYNSSLIQIADEILLYEIPLFAILNEYPMEMIIWMSVLLWFAIFTTAAAGVLGLVSRLQPYLEFPMILLVSGLLLPMIPLTMLGFSALISYTYPLYGILNLYVLSRLITYPFWRKAISK